jgi:tetratricopeptide (TPR) repeat protein
VKALAPWIVLFAFLSMASFARAESDSFDSRARLDRALAQYAGALEETNRDARLATFARAEVGFASLADHGSQNAALQTNIGNAALQAEHLGQAVLAYHRALRLDPNATTAHQNLVHMRTLMPSWVPRPAASEGIDALHFYRRIPATLRFDLAAGCFLLVAVSLALSVRRRDGGWRGLAFIAALAWLLLLSSVVFDSQSQKANVGVITTDETLARSADSRLAALALPEPLPAGAEVEILEERAQWARIRLHNGRDVWVRGSAVTRVERRGS